MLTPYKETKLYILCSEREEIEHQIRKGQIDPEIYRKARGCLITIRLAMQERRLFLIDEWDYLHNEVEALLTSERETQ